MTKNIKYLLLIIRNTCFLLIMLEVIFCCYYNYSEKKNHIDFLNLDLKITHNVHSDMSNKDIEKMYNEFDDLTLKWTAFTDYSLESYNGVYNNIDEKGHRKTNNIYSADQNAIQVFCFGGSTMYGIGSKDKETIPSILSKKLNITFPNKTFKITNFGVPGYNRNQENIQLQRELIKGNIPDVVIFFDGVNEVLTSYYNNEPGIPLGSSTRKLEFNSIKNYSQKIKLFFKSCYTIKVIGNLRRRIFEKQKETTIDTKQLVTSISNIYLKNVILMKNLTTSYDFKILNYLQPTIFSKKNLNDFEEIVKKNDKQYQSIYNKTYNQILSSVLFKEFVISDLTGVFDLVGNINVFTDFCHMNKIGNEIIANEILNDMSPFINNLIK